MGSSLNQNPCIPLEKSLAFPSLSSWLYAKGCNQYLLTSSQVSRFGDRKRCVCMYVCDELIHIKH